MIKAATTLIALLLTAEPGSEAVEVRDRGGVDLASFECRDTPRSTLIQRTCYDRAQATMIVNVRGTYYQYCDLPPATFDNLMTAPSMGQFFRQYLRGRDRTVGMTAKQGGCRGIRRRRSSGSHPSHNRLCNGFIWQAAPLMFP